MTNAERPEWNGGKTLNPLNRETFRLCPDASSYAQGFGATSKSFKAFVGSRFTHLELRIRVSSSA